MMRIKICHLTSVHRVYDIRIFYKECQSLAKAGYEVVLIARHDKSETIEEVDVVPCPVFKNRLARVLLAPVRMFFLALKQEAKIYHFHDPELIVTGLLLRLFTRAKVIYDIHEDYKTSIRQKHYLPRWLAAAAANFFGFFETTATKFFKLVLAEKYYEKRFPNGTYVLNYPVLETERWKESTFGKDAVRSQAGFDRPLPGGSVPGNSHLLYTGTMSEDRGALLHAEMLNYLKDVDIYMVGFCRKSLAQQLRQIAGKEQARLHLEGEEEFVHPARIQYYYQKGKWLAGLAVFPPTAHYIYKELTKFFEYMFAGIPVICSDFPVWRELVEITNAGLLVDPFDRKAITNAVEYLKTHPGEAIKMGENGTRAVLERYNWDLEEKKLLGLYKQILK
jgi:glycosyltransferase involved in cell wall biosynthesis